MLMVTSVTDIAEELEGDEEYQCSLSTQLSQVTVALLS